MTIIPENIVLGISRELTLNVIYTDRDNSGLEPEITWNCITNISENSTCDTFESSSNFSQSIEFLNRGE